MKFRKDFTQEVAASKADISVSSARRIENGRHQPNQAKDTKTPMLIHFESALDDTKIQKHPRY
ncbi:helix-turn-helix domain-containing protein [Paraglaciecola chathamensis]|uniref:helix-turn-helix domain-containing protein n=1 Tax=Paraglaciecola chathamensis TaxID=368405 RepID=UPI001E2D1C54|nr:helix-turn-helix transcriptional regulator [Paraglaciecola chathamensis]